MNILPRPKEISIGNGFFELGAGTGIVLDMACNDLDYEAAVLLRNEILSRTCLAPAVGKSREPRRPNRISMMKKDSAPYSYRLDVHADSVELSAGTSAGLFYGVQTLRQVIARDGARLPVMSIRDFPDMENRGFMHDVTRGKAPKLDTLKELADRMSYYKLNQLQLYIEHTFAFSFMPEVWRGCDPITASEIVELDEFCRRRHIELVPTLATFGHLYEVLRSRSFRHLCELEVRDGEPFTWPDRQLHHTLDVSNQESFVLVKRMLDEFIPLFSSDKVNICCDETFDLGEGKNRALAERVGKERLYMDFLLKIIGHAQGFGKTVLFWDDILIERPEFLKEIPKDVVCLTWQYGADVREEKIESIHAVGLKQYVCPGVSAWNRLAADMDNATENIVKSARHAKKYGALGL